MKIFALLLSAYIGIALVVPIYRALYALEREEWHRQKEAASLGLYLPGIRPPSRANCLFSAFILASLIGGGVYWLHLSILP